MLTNQTTQLKLNVTNINSFLIKKNSESRSLRLQKRNFLLTQEKQEETKKKEKKIESSEIKTTLNKITSTILSGPMSLFDKIMNFAGVILLGLLINNLPKIIEKVEKFFTDNKWLVDGIRFLFDVTGNVIQSVIGFITNFKSFAGSTQEQIKIQRDNITKEIENFNIMVGSMDVSLLSLMQDLGKKPTNQTPQSTPRQTPFQRTGGYGRYSTPSQQTPIPSPPTPVSPAPPPAAAPKPRGYARGGEVTRGSQVQQRGVSAPKIKSSTFTQGETGRAKAARQSVNYFENFKLLSNSFEGIADLDEENNKKFEELAINIKSLPSLFGEEKDQQKIPPGDPRRYNQTPIEVSEDEIIGYVGNTGTSGGAHIHIEDYSTPGASIPANVKSNIFVNGNPMTSGTMTSPIGPRPAPVPGASTNHMGEDWDQGWENKPIQLRGGLKFVSYVPMGSNGRFDGYGNVTIIQAPNGKKYFLGHLNRGPKNLAALNQKQAQVGQAQDQQNIPETGVISGKQSQIESQMFDYLKRNYGENVAYAMLSNSMRESGYRTDTPDNKKFQGMFQWSRNARWPNLVAWAKSQGLDPMDRGVQLRYAIKESIELGTLKRMQQAKTPQEAASIFYNEFERAAYSKPIVGSRNYDPNNPHETKNKAFLEQIKKRQTSRPLAPVSGAPVAPVLPPVDQETSLNSEEQSGKDVILLATQKYYIPFPVSVPTPVVVTRNGKTNGSTPLSDIWTS